MILFKIIFLFGEALWTILPGPVPRKKRKEHLVVNQKRKITGFIENQAELTDMKYGSLFKSSVSYSGCGAIAVYNAFHKLGIRKSFPGVLYAFEELGSALRGALGVSPIAIFFYMKKHCPGMKVNFRLNANVTPDLAVATVFNDKYNLFKALHTVCIEKTDKGYVIHNAYRRDSKGKYVATTPYATLKEAIQHVTARPALLCMTTIEEQ